MPGAIANCTSMGELMGAKFHSKMAVCDAKLRPPENGSLATFFICRMASTGSAPIAMAVPVER